MSAFLNLWSEYSPIVVILFFTCRRSLDKRLPTKWLLKLPTEHNLILVTWNVRDFRRLGVSRKPPHNKQEYRHAGMISFVCDEDQGARRATQVIEYIEFEYQQAQKRADKRLLVEVRIDRVIIHY